MASQDFRKTGAAETPSFRYADGHGFIDMLRQDVREGRIGVDRLLDLLGVQLKRLQRSRAE
jgi:hypothetical protein